MKLVIYKDHTKMCLKEKGNEGVKWIHLASTGASGHDMTTNGFHKNWEIIRLADRLLARYHRCLGQ